MLPRTEKATVYINGSTALAVRVRGGDPSHLGIELSWTFAMTRYSKRYSPKKQQSRGAPIDDLRQRYLRFDVACKTDKGEPVNVEMSFNPDANEPIRLEYHAARLFVGQGIHGKDKDYDDLKETYQIAILAN